MESKKGKGEINSFNRVIIRYHNWFKKQKQTSLCGWRTSKCLFFLARKAIKTNQKTYIFRTRSFEVIILSHPVTRLHLASPIICLITSSQALTAQWHYYALYRSPWEDLLTHSLSASCGYFNVRPIHSNEEKQKSKRKQTLISSLGMCKLRKCYSYFLQHFFFFWCMICCVHLFEWLH